MQQNCITTPPAFLDMRFSCIGWPPYFSVTVGRQIFMARSIAHFFLCSCTIRGFFSIRHAQSFACKIGNQEKAYWKSTSHCLDGVTPTNKICRNLPDIWQQTIAPLGALLVWQRLKSSLVVIITQGLANRESMLELVEILMQQTTGSGLSGHTHHQPTLFRTYVCASEKLMIIIR